jgi:hypothetical protein
VTRGLRPVPIERLEALLAGGALRKSGTLMREGVTGSVSLLLDLEDVRPACRVLAWADGFVDDEARSHPTLAVLADARETFVMECVPTPDEGRWTVLVRARGPR